MHPLMRLEYEPKSGAIPGSIISCHVPKIYEIHYLNASKLKNKVVNAKIIKKFDIS
jgi:hypothetical protein